jgi:colicin import membrane protein
MNTAYGGGATSLTKTSPPPTCPSQTRQKTPEELRVAMQDGLRTHREMLQRQLDQAKEEVESGLAYGLIAEAERAVHEGTLIEIVSQMDAIRNAIAAKIKRYIVQPPNLQGNPEAEFDVVVAPNGNVLTAKLRRSSGNAAYDSAVERAISGAQPLPMPSDPALLRQLRELKLTFRAQE